MEKTIRWWLLSIAAVGLLAVGAYLGWFAGHLGRGIADDPEQWGQFGDYLGGFLNPLIAAAAFYWLTQSVRIQHRELAETRVELAKAAEAQAVQVELLRHSIELNGLGSQLASVTAILTARLSELHLLDQHSLEERSGRQEAQASSEAEPVKPNPYATMLRHNATMDFEVAKLQRDRLIREIDEIRTRGAPPAKPHES